MANDRRIHSEKLLNLSKFHFNRTFCISFKLSLQHVSRVCRKGYTNNNNNNIVFAHRSNHNTPYTIKGEYIRDTIEVTVLSG